MPGMASCRLRFKEAAAFSASPLPCLRPKRQKCHPFFQESLLFSFLTSARSFSVAELTRSRSARTLSIGDGGVVTVAGWTRGDAFCAPMDADRTEAREKQAMVAKILFMEDRLLRQ